MPNEIRSLCPSQIVAAAELDYFVSVWASDLEVSRDGCNGIDAQCDLSDSAVPYLL